MSYQERRTIVSLITSALILIAYGIVVSGRYQAGALTLSELRPWAILMLIFIGISIAAGIVTQIIFHILLSTSIAIRKTIQNQDVQSQEIERSIGAEIVEDEMGKLIELKGTRAGYYFCGGGFVVALLALALSYAPAVMLNILFVSFVGGWLFEGAAQLYYFRKGI